MSWRDLRNLDKTKIRKLRKVRREKSTRKEIIKINNLLYHRTKRLRDLVEEGILSNKKGKFYIAKGNHPTLKQGELIDFKNLQKEDSDTIREIVYLKDKELRDELNDISKILEFGIEEQHGFISDRGIQTVANTTTEFIKNNGVGKAINFDLSNAFNTISERFIYGIFRFVFNLNKTDSKFLTDICTIDGFCYQGSPISPVIFNMAFISTIERLKGALEYRKKATKEKFNFTLVAYADDLTIISNSKFFHKDFINHLIYIIQDDGWKVNGNKTKIQNTNRIFLNGFEINTVRDKGFNKIKCWSGKRKVIKNKLRLLKFLNDRHNVIYSNKNDKKGKRIKIKDIINGFTEWLTRDDLNFVDLGFGF